MKLYLSSYRIPTPDDFIGLVGQEPDELRMGIITNAKDHRDNRDQRLHEFAEYLGGVGITNLTYIDLFDYQEGHGLEQELGRYHALWAIGGNTFDLRYAMKQSRFDEVIKRLLPRGLVYGGDSAGAIVAGDTLEGFESVDDPSNSPQRITDGMGLVKGVIIPHADNAEYKDRLMPLKTQHQNIPIHILNDNQALIVDDQAKKTVTA